MRIKLIALLGAIFGGLLFVMAAHAQVPPSPTNPSQVQFQHFNAQYEKIAPGNYVIASTTCTAAACNVACPAPASNQMSYLISFGVSCTTGGTVAAAPLTVSNLQGGNVVLEVQGNTPPVTVNLFNQPANAIATAISANITAPTAHTCAVFLQCFTD